jgi:hypothetical protein
MGKQGVHFVDGAIDSVLPLGVRVEEERGREWMCQEKDFLVRDSKVGASWQKSGGKSLSFSRKREEGEGGPLHHPFSLFLLSSS